MTRADTPSSSAGKVDKVLVAVSIKWSCSFILLVSSNETKNLYASSANNPLIILYPFLSVVQERSCWAIILHSAEAFNKLGTPFTLNF